MFIAVFVLFFYFFLYTYSGDTMFTVCYKILWAITTSIILLSSVYFTRLLKCGQLNVKKLFSSFRNSSKNSVGLTPKDTLMLSLAGRIGVGSIAGIALAIYIGGIGSIFWVWITTFLIAILSYVETYLGILYREKDEDGNYIGGPSYYIKNGLHNKKLACWYAVLIIVCYIGGFLGIQSNTITRCLLEIVSLSKYFVSIALVIITFICIFGGVNGISKITSKLVPFMTLFYLILFAYVICVNYTQISDIFCNIIKSAFQFDSFFGGFLSTCIIGLQRGIFSNEAGLGTGSIASSTTSAENASRQGYLQIVGVYITSLLICTATAFFILTTDYFTVSFVDINGIELMQYAFSYHFGNLGNIFLFAFILLFAFSTILTGYYYGECSLRFLIGKGHSKAISLLKCITLIVLFLGCIISAELLWKIIDLLVALLAIINIYALFSLREDISL